MASPRYRAVNCDSNNYGVASRQYELRVTPCRECPEGTITSTTAGVTCTATSNAHKATNGYTDPKACCTRPGYGFDGVRATVCAQGEVCSSHGSLQEAA
jgi:hypothetical protein